MKLILLFAFAFTLARGAVFVTQGTTQYQASTIIGAATTTVTGGLIYGGIGAISGHPEWAGKIVLLDRGGMTFSDKVKNVEAAGGLGVIIANNAPGGYTGSLGDGNSSSLPVLAISQEDGAALRANLGTVTIGDAVVVNSPALPSAVGHINETLISDGAKWIPSKLIAIPSNDSTAPAGTSITLVVTTNGTPPFTFQWWKDGAMIAGATNASYSILSATATDSGAYTCNVTNAAGAASGGPYNLTINSP